MGLMVSLEVMIRASSEPPTTPTLGAEEFSETILAEELSETILGVKLVSASCPRANEGTDPIMYPSNPKSHEAEHNTELALGDGLAGTGDA
mmetsp:Transcript_18650/g.39201  ORF Transcript_18650/g.39201 Transcript_18650/m.39201 type:complete len:91 (-) Transcript_18650:1778-2050(-)